MQQPELAQRIVSAMYDGDPFSIWLGIERVRIEPGSVILKMQVRKEMLNGFGIAHGGITYSLADSALAFASNSHGRKCISIETSISHTQAVKEGDVLSTKVNELHLGNKTAIYEVRIENQNGELVALFKGTVYRTSKNWFE